MQEINWAYDEIQRMRAEGGYSGGGTYYRNYNGDTGDAKSPVYSKIRGDINAKRFAEAERELMAIAPEARIAEWHYLMSLILLKKKVTTHYIPPDMLAIKILFEIYRKLCISIFGIDFIEFVQLAQQIAFYIRYFLHRNIPFSLKIVMLMPQF